MPKVLIVDDSLSVRRALERVLSAKDFEVVAARSGEEALERFSAVSPDLTIADVIMPGIGGFELCRKLRERSPETPVILISGVGDAQIEQQARAVGAAAIIPKPFSPEDLSAALGAALNPPEPQPAEPELFEPESLEPESPEPEAPESEPEVVSAEPPDADLAAVLDADPPVPDADLQADLQSVETQSKPQDFDSQAGLQSPNSQEPDTQEADLQSDPQDADPQAADFDGDDSFDAEPQVEPQDASLVKPVLPKSTPTAPVLSAPARVAPAPTAPAPREPDTQPHTKPDLAVSLNRFLEKPEVLAATLSDRQGTRLVHVGEYPSDAEALANYSRFLLIASDVLGTHYGADPTNGMVLEFPRYALYLGRIDADHILSLHLSDAKALSVVRYLMNRTLPELALELRALQA